MINNMDKSKRNWFLLLLISINFLYPIYSAKAFIPNVYIGNKKTLIDTSLGIGITASQYVRFGQLKEAISLTKLAISLNPNEVELWIILSKAQLYNNQLDEALRSIQKAKEINPKISNITFTQASIEMQKGDIESAIKSIKESIKLDKKNANAYFLLGNAKLIQKKNSEAIQAFNQATTINPKHWQALNNKGLVLFEIGEAMKAIAIWRKVLEIKADPEPKLALAIALYSLEPNNNEAIRLTTEALQENPNYYFEEHQEEQLWGKKLRESSLKLFKNPKLSNVIDTASANSNFTNEKYP